MPRKNVSDVPTALVKPVWKVGSQEFEKRSDAEDYASTKGLEDWFTNKKIRAARIETDGEHTLVLEFTDGTSISIAAVGDDATYLDMKFPGQTFKKENRQHDRS
jgi:hypothetical protein